MQRLTTLAALISVISVVGLSTACTNDDQESRNFNNEASNDAPLVGSSEEDRGGAKSVISGSADEASEQFISILIESWNNQDAVKYEKYFCSDDVSIFVNPNSNGRTLIDSMYDPGSILANPVNVGIAASVWDPRSVDYTGNKITAEKYPTVKRALNSAWSIDATDEAGTTTTTYLDMYAFEFPAGWCLTELWKKSS